MSMIKNEKFILKIENSDDIAKFKRKNNDILNDLKNLLSTVIYAKPIIQKLKG